MRFVGMALATVLSLALAGQVTAQTPEPKLWGYVQATGEYGSGFEVPVVRILGEAPTSVGTIIVEHDFMSGLKWAALRRSFGRSASLTVGQFKTPANWDFPPPGTQYSVLIQSRAWHRR